MINLNNLPKITKRSHKRLGQGHGSGKGKTGGRGTKGQNAKGNVSITFSAGNMAMVKRLPLIRGKYRNKPVGKKQLILNIKYLNILPANTVVDADTLVKFRIFREEDIKIYKVKILGDGELNVPLTVKLPCSKNAIKKIEKAGGKVEKIHA